MANVFFCFCFFQKNKAVFFCQKFYVHKGFMSTDHFNVITTNINTSFIYQLDKTRRLNGHHKANITAASVPADFGKYHWNNCIYFKKSNQIASESCILKQKIKIKSEY